MGPLVNNAFVHEDVPPSFREQRNCSSINDEGPIRNQFRGRDVAPSNCGHELICPICQNENIKSSAITLPTCNHSFCTSCFLSWIETEIGRGNADDITCPYIIEDDGGKIGRQCKISVELSFLQKIMDKKSFDRMVRLRNAALMRKNPEYHQCMTPNCTNAIHHQLSGHDGLSNSKSPHNPSKVHCNMCRKSWCIRCKASPFHENMTCEQHKKREQKNNQPDLNLDSTRKDFLLKKFQSLWKSLRTSQSLKPGEIDRSRAGEEARYKFETVKFTIDNGSICKITERLFKICCRCGNGIELEEGCKKVKCICGYRFCYNCGSENAQCKCTPSYHGFIDNATGKRDQLGLYEKKSYT